MLQPAPLDSQTRSSNFLINPFCVHPTENCVSGEGEEGRRGAVATLPPSPPTDHASPPAPHPMPHPHPSPQVLPALGIETIYKYQRCLAMSLSKLGPGAWPPPSGVLTLAPLLSVPPHTHAPHLFIVNSHFCTGFEPGDVGSHFFSLCWHLRPLEAWPTSWCDLEESQSPFSHLPPVLRISR